MGKGIDLKKTVIKMDNKDAVSLWTLVRDLLAEDKEGKDSGKGGYFAPADTFVFLRCLEQLAIGIDDYNDSVSTK